MPDPSPYDEAGAAEALAASLANEEAPVAPEPVSEEEPAVEQASDPAPASEQSDSAPADEELVPRADLEALLEGVTDDGAREAIITAYKSFQGAFTKRSQETSALRRQFEGVDPEQARQAYDFVQNLTSDADFAREVHGELAAMLENAGLSPAQAEQEAARQVDQASSGDLSEFGLTEDNPLVRELEEIKAWRADVEMREKTREATAEREALIRDIERQDQAIRRDNAAYDEGDMEAIYKIAASTNGDLIAAQEYYSGLQDRFLTDYVAKKKSTPGGVAPVGGGAGHSEEPVVIANTDDAHRFAAERLKQILASREG